MKKLFFLTLIIFNLSINAQDLSKGKWMIEANTGSFTPGNTSFYLISIDGNTSFSIGLEGGYFVSDNLNIKAGLGYNDFDTNLVYKAGAKYYLNDKFPIGADITGASTSLWLGLQGGYAWFLNDSVSIEPTLRYNLPINDAAGIFQALIGFAIHI